MKIALLFIFLILLAHEAGAESIITAEVNESGNALWTLEKRQLLTAPEMNEWAGLIKTGQNISRYREIAEFDDMIKSFLQSARNFSKRPMNVEKVNISYDTIKTLSGGFGVIRYNFWWNNFSHTDSGNIYVGDAFQEGLVLPPGSVLVIRIPEGYDVRSASPYFDKREGDRLIWEGTLYSRFGRGEPEVVLTRTVYRWAAWLVIGALVFLVFGASVVFWKRKRSSVYRTVDTTQVDGKDEVTVQPPIPAIEQVQFPIPVEEDLLEEEKIKRFLIKSGGQAFQSDIVKDIGVSKSKISMVLSRMKENGKIIKIRKGRENLIRLTNN